jgi:hypothetical protein
MRWVRHGACLDEIRNAHKHLFRNPDINGRMILKFLREIACENMHWVELT